jgi:hypothetical protein
VLTRASETSATKRQYDRYREHWCFVLARLLLRRKRKEVRHAHSDKPGRSQTR